MGVHFSRLRELTHELKRMDKKGFECGGVDGSVLNGNATASVPYP